MKPDFVDRYNFFMQQLPEVKSPKDVAYRMIDFSRQMGKTHMMIEKIPDTPNYRCVIVGFNMLHASDLRDRIVQSKSNLTEKNIIIKSARSFDDLKKIKEFADLNKIDMFVDNCVWDTILYKMIDELYS